MGWFTDFFYSVYEELEDGVTAGARWVYDKAEAVYDGVVAPVEWIYEALQGDWNEERTPAQIAADSVLAMVPIIDQILDVRDICANCKRIRSDFKNGEAWLGFCLCLIGLIPTLGSLVKGVLKILFVYIRKFGKNAVVLAVDAAIDAVRIFLENEKVIKILGTYDLSKCYKLVADKLAEVKGMVNGAYLASLFGKAIDSFGSLILQLRKVLPDSMISRLGGMHQDMIAIQRNIGNNIENCLGPLRKILGDAETRLNAHAVAASGRGVSAGTEAGHGAVKAVGASGQDAAQKAGGGAAKAADDAPPIPRNAGEAAQSNAKNPTVIGNRELYPADVARMANKQKGLFGEIVSDNYMQGKGHRSVLKPDRQVVHDLDGPARGRGIDGVYAKEPPPGYIVTEVKYRTSGEFNPNTKLPKLKGGSTQMDDEWIGKGLTNAVGANMKKNIADQGYESWVLVVDPTGTVTNIYKLDANAKVIDIVTP